MFQKLYHFSWLVVSVELKWEYLTSTFDLDIYFTASPYLSYGGRGGRTQFVLPYDTVGNYSGFIDDRAVEFACSMAFDG